MPQQLTGDVLCCTFQYLPLTSLLCCALVNKQWYQQTCKDVLWFKPCQKMVHQLQTQSRVIAPLLLAPLVTAQWRTIYQLLAQEMRARKVELDAQYKELEKYEDYGCDEEYIAPEPQRPASNSMYHAGAVAGFSVNPSLYDFKFESAVNVELAAWQLQQLELKIQLVLHMGGATGQFVAGAYRRFAKFFKLQQKYPGEYLIPSLDIEMIWVSFMIRPAKYESWCKSEFGYIVPHAFVTSEVQNVLFEAALCKTEQLWKQEYNELYLPAREKKEITRFEHDTVQVKYVQNRKSYWYSEDAVECQKLAKFVCLDASVPVMKLPITDQDCIKDRDWYHLYSSYLNKINNDLSSQLGEEKMYRAARAYFMYLYLIAKYPQHSKHPTYVIDIAWHAHMCHPTEYAKDMLRYLHAPLYHNPWPETVNAECDSLWKKEFSISIHDEIKYV